MDSQLKAKIEAAIEFRIGKTHNNQAIINDIEKLMDAREHVGWVSVMNGSTIGWVPNTDAIMKRKDSLRSTPVYT